MSITQTAATLEAYDIKIRELKTVEDALRSELFSIDAAIAFSKFVTLLAGFLAIIGIFFNYLIIFTPGSYNFACFMVQILTLSDVIWLIFRLNQPNKRYADRKAVVRKIQVAAKDSQNMRTKKSAIVSGVVAVTNMEMSAATIAQDTVESPVDSSMSEKTCPMCAETVKAAAKICKHCKHAF